jgi:hypothetical protein
MRVLVCGGRAYDDSKVVFDALDDINRERGPIAMLIQGGAREWSRKWSRYVGADWLALEWSLAREIESVTVPAKWRELGRRAGPIRNERMAHGWLPDLVVAFPGGTGTANMMDIARRMAIEIVEPVSQPAADAAG